MTKPRCQGFACKRPAAVGDRFCGRCWSLVPTEIKLALWDHRDAIDQAPVLARFLVWCEDRLLLLAGHEAYRARCARRERQDPDDLHWRYSLDAAGELVLESRANRAAEEQRT